MKRMIMKNVYILLYGGLLFACAFPSMTLFYDQCNTPKWLCTLFMAGLLAVCTAIYYGIKRKRPTGFCHFEAWSEATAMAITLESLYALVSLFKYPATWQLGIAGTFDNPAGLALFLCSLLPFPLGIVLQRSTDKGKKVIYMTVILLATVTLLLTHSRTGILCLAAYALMGISSSGKCSTRLGWKIIIPVITLAGCFALFFKSGSTSGRMFILERTWELIRESPWVGHGTGGFNREYMNRQADFFRQHPESPATMLADETGHPLNEFAYLWVEYGIAVPLVLLFLWMGTWHILRKRKDMPSQTGTYTLISLLLSALFSYPLKYPITWVIIGYCAVIVGMGYFKPLLLPKLLKALTVLFLASFGIGLWIHLAREIPWEKEWGHAARETLKGKGQEMMPRYARLYTHFPHNPEFLYNYTAELFQAGHTEKAWHTAQSCRKQWSKYNLELLTGDICRELRKYEAAICHYQRAAYMCPVRFAPLEGLYYAYRNIGDTIRADSIAQIIQQKKVKIPSYDVERIKKEIKPQKQRMFKNVP